MCQSEVARSSSPSIRRAFLLGTRGGDPSGDAVGQGVPPRRWARLHDLAGERTTDDLLDAPAGGEEAIEVARLAEAIVGHPLPGAVMHGGSLARFRAAKIARV